MVFQGFLGLGAFLALCWGLSENRKEINYKTVLMGLGIQIAFAILITQIPTIRHGFESLSTVVDVLKRATEEGTRFVFGYLGGGDQPFVLDQSKGAAPFIYAFQVLPMIMIVSAVSMLLFYWKVLPVIVRGLSWAFQRTLKIGGALGVVAAAKVFFGNIEAPLLIRPYLKDFSRNELFTVMVCGMATTSASVMALISAIMETSLANPIAHILTASIISIPAAITVARIMVPQEGEPTGGKLVVPYKFTNWMDAVSKGTGDGLNIFLNILAMLIVVLALVALGNAILGTLPDIAGEPITLQRIFGLAMAPVTWLMGVPWEEAMVAGKLLGTKTVLNEIVAFLDLSELPKGVLSEKSSIIMTYALCGFANFSSIGIVIGGIGAMVPERRDEIVSFGLKSVLAGTIATCMSGTIIGILTTLGSGMSS